MILFIVLQRALLRGALAGRGRRLTGRAAGRRGTLPGMCRSIRQLRKGDEAGPATTGEAEAAALQYVRKISGFRAPSAKNAEAFEDAVHEIAARHRAPAPVARARASPRARTRSRIR